MIQIQIEANQAGQRFDKFLNKYLPNAGSSFLYKMLRKKNITLNGKKADGREILNSKDEISFFFKEETFELFRGAATLSEDSLSDYRLAYKQLKGIQVIYEDEDVIILNKPQGILSQKAKENDLSINEWLIGYLLETKKADSKSLKEFMPSVCNRLDRNTSGLVLCGCSLKGSQELSRLLKTRELKKLYHAIVIGTVEKPMHLDGFLTKDKKTNKVTYSRVNGDDAIQTDFKPLTAKNNLSLLEVHLITGKTHQIRAHLASIGHPILGDSKYGKEAENKKWKSKYQFIKYQFLHAYEIVFPDKLQGITQLESKSFTAPYPKDFETIREGLK